MGTQRPTAKDALLEFLLEVREAIQEAENLEWHHGPDGTPEAMHYGRLIKLEERIDAQITRFPVVLESTRDAETD